MTIDFELITPKPNYFNRWYRLIGKTMIDRFVGVIALILLMPIMLLIALTIRLTLGRNVLFIQSRVGLEGKVFTCFKYRTMDPDRRTSAIAAITSDRRTGLPSSNDPRHTVFGSFLRRYGLDELPQLINVVRGEMSLVGPRPEITEISLQYNEREKLRFSIKPGLTGYWQITRRSDAIDLRTYAYIDIEYAQNVSLLNDIRIILRTPSAILFRPAATEYWRGL